MKEIEEKAEKVLEALSNALKEAEISGVKRGAKDGGIERVRKEVYYINELKNVFRKESEKAEICYDKEFLGLMKKNAPKVDEQGYIIAEVGTWVK